jgi:lysophospholipase L1-like esterase
LRRERPDIVLPMIGTNDVVQGRRRSTAPERLGDLVDRIASVLPDAHVLFASIPQIGGSPNAERVEDDDDEVSDRAAAGALP